MNKYLEKIAGFVPSLNSSLKAVKGDRSPELGGLMRPVSAVDLINSHHYRPPTARSLRMRLSSDQLNYKNRAKKDIY